MLDRQIVTWGDIKLSLTAAAHLPADTLRKAFETMASSLHTVLTFCDAAWDGCKYTPLAAIGMLNVAVAGVHLQNVQLLRRRQFCRDCSQKTCQRSKRRCPSSERRVGFRLHPACRAQVLEVVSPAWPDCLGYGSCSHCLGHGPGEKIQLR